MVRSLAPYWARRERERLGWLVIVLAPHVTMRRQIPAGKAARREGIADLGSDLAAELLDGCHLGVRCPEDQGQCAHSQSSSVTPSRRSEERRVGTDYKSLV